MIGDALIDYQSAQLKKEIAFSGASAPRDENPFPTEVDTLPDLSLIARLNNINRHPAYSMPPVAQSMVPYALGNYPSKRISMSYLLAKYNRWTIL